MDRETIEISKKWIKRLIEIRDLIESSQRQQKDSYVNYLLGYIDSAKSFLENPNLLNK